MRFSTIFSTMAAVAIPAISAAPAASPSHLATNDMGAGIESMANENADNAEPMDDAVNAIEELGDGIMSVAGSKNKRQEGPTDALKSLTEQIDAKIKELEAQMAGATGIAGRKRAEEEKMKGGDDGLGSLTEKVQNIIEGLQQQTTGVLGGAAGVKRTDHEEHDQDAGSDEIEDIVDELLGSLGGEEEEDAEHKKPVTGTRPVEYTKPMGQKWPTQMKRTEHKFAAADEGGELADELPDAVDELSEGLEELADELAGIAGGDEEEGREMGTRPQWKVVPQTEAVPVMKTAVIKRQEEADALPEMFEELADEISGLGDGFEGLDGDAAEGASAGIV
ncbi:hypothetical protein PTMSG1_03954 [Pyrenophora teres f. maculata]|nr:hypothetical protein PTMSG1_03954 [Pyrenophora teres f. maculata]